MKPSRQGTATKGQLTSGLRTGPKPRRSQKSLFTEVQLQHRDGAITQARTSTTSPAYGETSLEDIKESEAMKSGLDSKRKLPTSVAKMPSMLSRETTSFTVFSNLAAHNRPMKHGTRKVEGESSAKTNRGQQTQLLNALKDNDLKQATKILKSDADMNLNIADENGQTPLHIAAFRGLEHPAYMLLQAGANINLQNMVTGYTALHEAVSNRQRHMVEFLLCCGADQSIQTKAGFTALDISRDSSFNTEFEALVDLVSKGRIELASIGQSISRFKFVGIVIEPRKIVEPTYVVCRKRRVGGGNSSVTIDKREEIVSDEFSLHLGTKEAGYQVWVTLPIESGKNSSSEEVVVRTADGQAINTSDVWQGKESLWCKFSTTLHMESTFLVVCRPRTEQLAVGRGASVVSSQIDQNVKVRIGKGSFSRNAHISLRVLELDEDTEMDEGEIMSSTPFYKIYSSEPLEKSIDVELQEPLQYGMEKCATVVLTHHVFKGSWTSVDTVKRTGKDQMSVLFPISNLPVHAVVVKCKKGYDASSVSGEVQKAFDQLTNQSIEVCFLCLAKRLHTENMVGIVLECCKAKHIDSRRRFWSSKGFVEQQERTLIDSINVVPNRSFSITFYKNILLKEGRQNYMLQFHPKRYNVVQFDVTVNDDDSQSGRVYVYPNKDESGDGHSETEADLLTSIDVSLDAKALERLSNLNVVSGNKTSHDDVDTKIGGKGKNLSSPSDDSLKQKTGKHTAGQDSEAESNAVTYFLTNEFLGTLVEQMEEDWYKIFVLMGVPFSDIDEALARDASPGTCKLRIFKEWRDGEKGREDLGLPLLLSALFKGGRRDVANNVQIELRDWYTKPENKKKKLYAWLCMAYQNSDLLVPTAYPSPMSDSYLVLMADDLVPSREMGRTLGLPDSDIDDILECSHYMYPGIKVMKMLTLFRGAIPSKLDALEKLIGCLEKLNYAKLRNYAVMCAKAWVKRTATRKDDPLRTQVGTLMKQLQELHVSDPDT